MDKRKFWGSILGTTMFLVMLLGLTYAYYTWRSSDTSLTFSISDSYFKCQSGIETHTTSLEPVNDYKLGSYQTFVVNNIGMSDTTFSVTMDIESIDEELIAEDVKYKLVVDETGGSNDCTTTNCTSVGEGSFANAKVGMNTLVSPIFLPNNVNYKYYLFIYIDGEMSENTNRAGKSINGTLEVCEIVVFLDYQGGNRGSNPEFLKVTKNYNGLPTTVSRNNTVIKYNLNATTLDGQANRVVSGDTTSINDDVIVYTFGGWYTEKNGGGTNIVGSSSVLSPTNHTLYAKWTNNPTGITLPTPTRTGYTFNNWLDPSDNAVTATTGSYNPETSITLKAKWTPHNYDVNFNLNGGTLSGVTSGVKATFGNALTINNPIKIITIKVNDNNQSATISANTTQTQTFNGWAATNFNASTAQYGDSLNAWSNGNTLVKATKFRNLRSEPGTVTLTANWSNPSPMAIPTITKDGYTCTANTNSDGNGTSYASGANYTPSVNGAPDINLYARCTINTATITINKNGSLWAYDNIKVALYSGSTAVMSGTSNDGIVEFSKINSGTYKIYASKSLSAIGALVDTGQTITIGTTGSQTINYYDLVLNAGNGISSVSGADTYLKNQTASIAAVVADGYAFEKWTVNSGNSPASEKTKSTTVKLTNKTELTATATDSEVPEISDIAGGTTLKVASQTLTLKCSDNIGVTAYYWGPTEPTSESSITTTTASDIASLTGNGLTKTVTTNGTYWFGCRDAAKNWSKKSIIIRKYVVNNLLETIAGTTGTYTSSNYKSETNETYYIKDGTSLTLASIYTIPTGSLASKFKGYSTTFTTSAASPSTTAPKVSNDSTTYYMWFNRNTYNVTVTKPSNGTVKAETVTKTGNSVTASSAAATLTVKYGDTVKATATANSGYTFSGWSGGYVSGTTTPVTGGIVTAAKTITGTFSDIPPSASISSTSTLKSTKQTATLTCTDTVGVNGYYWGTTKPTTSSTFTSITSTTNMSITKEVSAAGTYYLACKDTAGNTSVATEVKKTYYTYYVQNLLETIAGTTGTYTSANYVTNGSKGTYIVPSGTTLTLASIYTIPTGSSATNFKGYSTAFTTSAASPSTTAPTVASGTTYYMWFNRNTYSVTLTKPTNGTVKAETVTKTGNSVTASSAAATLTVKYGDKVKATATANSGYTFAVWSGGYISGTTNPTTGGTVTAAKTITGTFSDIPPSASITSTSTLKSTKQTATLTCTDTTGIVGYYWGTTKPTTSSTFTSITSTTNMSITKEVSAAGTYYLACKDTAGNTSVATEVKKTYYTYYVQNLLETIAGTTGTYTSANYATDGSKGTYIVPSGTKLTLSSIYTIPPGSSATNFKGYSTAFTTSAASLSTTDPTVASGTTYYMWFNRNTYTLTLDKRAGIASVSGAGTYKHGATVTVKATLSTGYNFSSWILSDGGSVSTSTTYNHTITKNTTLIATAAVKTSTITYKQGSTTVGTSTCAQTGETTLTKWSDLGATISQSSYGWGFGYWANGTATYANTYVDGATIICPSSDITIYAVYSRDINFYKFYSTSPDETLTQYWNPYGSTNGTHLSGVTAPGCYTVGDDSYGWNADANVGYRNDTNYGEREYLCTGTIYPARGEGNNLYQVNKRTITFKSGANAGTNNGTATQYLVHSSGTSSVTAPTPTAITNWTAVGYRPDTAAGNATDYCTSGSTTCAPSYNEGPILYGVYSRTITFYSGVNKGTKDGTRTQYLNSSGNKVSAITAYTPTAITNWTALGYRTDTTAANYTNSCSKASTSCKPPYTSENTLYGVYSRTLTVSYNGNGNTGGTAVSNTTKPIYLNTNSTTTSPQTVTLPENTYKKDKWAFYYWAEGSADGTRYDPGATYNPNLAYNASSFAKTMYVKWKGNGAYIRYNVNGGTITSQTTSATDGTKNTWTTDSTGLISKSSNGGTATPDFHAIWVTHTGNLVDYNNPNYVNITRAYYHVNSGAEWICLSGCTTANKTYSHSTEYSPEEFCDITNGDCTVVLGVNWVQNTVNINYSTNGGTITSNSGGYSWTVDSANKVYLNSTLLTTQIKYGGTTTSDGVNNYNNSSYLHITNNGLSAKSGEEWICLSGCTNAGATFNQDTVYSHNAFCNASSGNCTVVLGVNWERVYKATWSPTAYIFNKPGYLGVNFSAWNSTTKIQYFPSTGTYSEYKKGSSTFNTIVSDYLVGITKANITVYVEKDESGNLAGFYTPANYTSRKWIKLYVKSTDVTTNSTYASITDGESLTISGTKYYVVYATYNSSYLTLQ